MEVGIGSIVDGKVTGITKFGAFVEFEEGKTGLVHISEIAQTYVNDIREHLTEGQTVKAKVIGIDPSGRISLSIKKAVPPPPRPAYAGNRSAAPRGYTYNAPAAKEPADFEDRLKQFMQNSDSRMSDLRSHNDKRGGGSRRGGRK